MRIYLYILAGIASALIGWNLGQFFLTDLGLLKSVPEIVLFPFIAISLSVGMVMNEIFLSNPTRPKLNFRILPLPLAIAAGLGLLSGLLAGCVSQIVFLPQIRIPTLLVRTLGWLLIGGSVGVAEGLSWRWHSIEAGDRQRAIKRLKTSIVAGCAAALAAAIFFELVRKLLGELPREYRAIEDPVGFAILGAFLGFVFSCSTSPSYMAALRAGGGFEYTEVFDDGEQKPLPNAPMIDGAKLRFVNDGEATQIEEGFSIQLPASGKITIGSDEGSLICIPGIPASVAALEIQSREAILKPHSEHFRLIKVNGEALTSAKPIRLRHNHVLTFHSIDQAISNGKEFFRFVYYNRFLDPQA
jgi:hypothetical protein